MEGHLQDSPKHGYQVDSDDVKYVSQLSTLLVASIQEAKDRISQIEYIFCSQLYPNFQFKSKILQKIYSEARKAADDAWIEKENNLLLEIENLKLEKQDALEENKLLKLEKAKPSKDLEEEINLLNAKLRSQQFKIDELESDLLHKSKEVDEGTEMQDKLVQMVERKASKIYDINKQLKEHQEKTNGLLEKLDDLEKKVNELQQELREKTEELAKVEEQNKNLQKKTHFQALKIFDFEQQPIDYEKEKRLIMAKLEHMEDNVGWLEGELRKKTEEAEKGRKFQEQLLQKIDLSGSEMMKSKKQLEEHEKEEQLLLAKVKGLEKKVDELHVSLTERSSVVAEGRDSYKKLLQQIDLKPSEVVSEKKKRRDVVDAYKRLKSQYNFLLTKSGLTTENMLPQNKLEEESEEEESDSLRYHQNPITSPDLESKNLDTSAVACDTSKVKFEIGDEENLEDEKGVKSIQTSSFHSHSSNGKPIVPKCPTSTKSAPVVGKKRPASYWRDTRSRQCQGGPDPHDDFLDTPLENIRENLNKAMKEEVHDFPGPAPTDMNLDSSDDETQDMNANHSPQKQQMPVPVAGNGKRGFKYVEPVRKKAEREKLKGIECKQCKKFYDAVLPNGKDTDGNKQNFRCEHHDGVSRHRYRYAPPLTPEGFWNIGFESEM